MKKASVITILSIILLGFCIELSGDDIKIAPPWKKTIKNFRDERQIYKGFCEIRCDSLVDYNYTSSFDAYGHVRVRFQDSTTICCDSMCKDGLHSIIQFRNNVLVKTDGWTCVTDTLDIDEIYNIVYYMEGGKLYNEEYSVTSDWGEYHFDDNKAYFYYGVVIESNTSDIKFYTDTAIVETLRHEVTFPGPTCYNTDSVVGLVFNYKTKKIKFRKD